MALKSRKKTIADDINRLLQNSMLTGIPQIVAAGNWKKRLTRSLVFVLCVGGFIYQTMTFMNVYWKYETVVDVQVYSPIEIERPAFTVCTEMGFMSSKFCPVITEEFMNKSGARCKQIEDTEYYDHCFCLPRLCTPEGKLKNVTLLEDEGYFYMHEQPWEVVKPYMATDQDLLQACEEKNTRLDNPDYFCKKPENSVEVPCISDGFYPEACFTRDSLYGKPDVKPMKVLSFGEIWLTIRQLEMEYPTTRRVARTFISFHSPYTILNPMEHGFVMEPKRKYNFRLSKVVKNLLPHPYETDCIDYLEMWKLRGGKGPTNLKECIQECLRNRSLEIHGCLMRGIDYPGYDRHCTIAEVDEKLVPLTKECMDTKCKPACYEEYYVTDADSSTDPLQRDCFKPYLLSNREDYNSIVVLFSGMETTIYTYSPKYEDIETFSYIGGYIGMWLGISLIALFDFLETVVTLMQYPLKRLRHYREKNKVGAFQTRRRIY